MRVLQSVFSMRAATRQLILSLDGYSGDYGQTLVREGCCWKNICMWWQDSALHQYLQEELKVVAGEFLQPHQPQFITS